MGQARVQQERNKLRDTYLDCKLQGLEKKAREQLSLLTVPFSVLLLGQDGAKGVTLSKRIREIS